MTKELFREDGYLVNCDGKVIAIEGDSVVLDQTVFYPLGGGQPGDTGIMQYADGTQVDIIDTQKGEKGILHILQEGIALPQVDETVKVELNWERRHRLMRMHSCMHLLCSIVPFGVTGGSIREDSARLDFDAEDPMDKEAINIELNRLIEEDHPMTISWISEEELDAQPELVR
ncbi:MAG: alanyl-tRNA editing protein, partial [Gammaproteobacteria bacterium]|nr:alanyl-tRNA editing protein [Gammaproteobacteria bacterium]